MCPFVVRNRCKQSNAICEKGMYKNEITIVFSAKIKWQQVHAFSVWTLNKFSHAWQKALFSTFSLFILSLCISFVAQVWILSCLELSPAVDSDSNLIKSYFMLQCPLFIIFLISQFHPLLLFFFCCVLLFLLLQSFLSVSAFLPTIQMAQRLHDVLSLCAGGGDCHPFIPPLLTPVFLLLSGWLNRRMILCGYGRSYWCVCCGLLWWDITCRLTSTWPRRVWIRWRRKLDG